jgi:hypothetical protein
MIPLLAYRAEPPSPIRKLGVGLLAIMALASAFANLSEHRQRTVGAAAYRTALLKALPDLKGKVVVWGDNLVWEWLVTPNTVYPPLDRLTVVSIGVFTATPLMRLTLDHVGVGDLSETLCKEPGVHLIADPKQVEMLQQFCNEHQGVKPVYERRFEIGPTSIFQSTDAVP